MRRFYLGLGILVLLAGCDESTSVAESGVDAAGFTPPSAATVRANRAFGERLPLSDTTDFDDARRGLIAQIPDLTVTGAEDQTVWHMPDYAFIGTQFDPAQIPGSVNPSLWRQESLNNLNGLFKVAEGIYQLRGFDLANMTLIAGKTGWIVVDPLTSAETAEKAFRFAQETLGAKPVRAVIFTHSHIDHFGGIDGVLATLSDEEKAHLTVVAPEGFMEEATSENIIAGTAMGRRAIYMYGRRLPRSERGHVGSGLGKSPAFGTFGLLAPTVSIRGEGDTREIDGVTFQFMNVPASEAPAEFVFYLPQWKAFCGAELVSHTQHNLYTLRGAKVRDALRWSGYIDTARVRFAEADTFFGSHHWPVWGQSTIQTFLAGQRDTYRYIHDQTVRMMNAGATPNEIAEQLELPASLGQSFANRDYYGTVRHNAKAVYQYYMGWFTGNPAMLDPLPEEEAAQRMVALMGGVDNVVAEAQRRFDDAAQAKPEAVGKEYRWVAQLLNQAVFADPGHQAARTLLAATYDQLGYLSESAAWRDFYLTGAYELRHGGPDKGISPAVMKHILLQTPVERFFDSMAVSLKGPEADGKSLRIGIDFTDLQQQFVLILNNSVLRYEVGPPKDEVNATLHITHTLFVDLIVGQAGLKETLFGDQLEVEGSTIDLLSFFRLLQKPEGTFTLVEP